ncbi:hypothetical protein ACFX15_031013 [Malus domestica]
MDAQDLVRSHSTGHESHGGVHVCSKCGWPFPNPHPSARHRRAHKRICGTIDGYKLVGLQENTQSDDEHSDDDRKTPSSKVLERSNNEKGSGLIGEGSVRSEDAVFSDAVAEFSDSGSGAGTGEGLEDVLKSATSVEKVAKNDLNAIQSLNDGEINENTTNQLGYAPESQGSMSITGIDSMKRPESAVQDDRNGSEDDVHPVNDVSEDSKKAHTTDSVIESSLTSISQEGQVKEIKASDQDRNLPYGLVAPNEVSSETAEGASKLERTVEVTSDSLRDIEVVPSEKEHIHVFDLDIPQAGLSPDVESVEHAQASVNTTENKVDTTDEMHCFSSGGLTESSNSKGEGSANVHVLSVPDDLPVVDNAAAMLEGFKTYKEEKLDQPTFLDSWEQFNDEENGVKNPVSNDNSQIFQSSNLSGGTVASSDMHDLEASHELDGGSSKPMVKEVPFEEANVSQVEIKTTENQGSDEKSPPADIVMPQIAKSLVGSPEGQETYDNYESLQVNFPESDTNVASDANSLSSTGINQTTHSVDLDDNEKDEKCDLSADHSSKGPVEGNVIDDGDHETEKYAITEDEYIEVSMEKIVAENPITSLENTSCLSKLQVNSTDILNGDDSGDHDKGETEKSVVSGNKSRGGSIEENLLVKPKLNLDSSSNSSRADLNVVSDTKKSVMESEIDCNEKVQLEVGGSTAAGSDHGPNVESSQKSLMDCGMKEVGLSSLDTESSVPNLSSLATESSVPSFTAAEDNCSRELLGVSLQEESDKLVEQQTSSSALDVVDSNSQTDSLEGNWGSVSVYSIQSEAQAVIDAEAVPPTDPQASLEGKAKLASERQYSDKSDTFEAPSFMTLVEPGGVDNQKATAAEIKTAQNPEQPRPAPLQAGWFPSITHVVNESPGRKKNEEIIAKVTNWSTGKQHTPLKNLLGEAYLENKAKSPNQKESQAPALQKDDKAVTGKDNGRVTTTVNSILAPESPTGQASRKDNAKEWNSPARYPTEIKSEKRKAKGRPYWAQFLCCSSAHQHP